MRLFRKIFQVLTLFILHAALLINPVYAADTLPSPNPAGLKDLQNLFQRIVEISVGLAFVALLVVLVMAGIKFVTSGGPQGDSKAFQSASQAVTWGLLGMLFLVLAWLILKLIGAFTGVDVTQFCLNFSSCSS